MVPLDHLRSQDVKHGCSNEQQCANRNHCQQQSPLWRSPGLFSSRPHVFGRRSAKQHGAHHRFRDSRASVDYSLNLASVQGAFLRAALRMLLVKLCGENFSCSLAQFVHDNFAYGGAGSGDRVPDHPTIRAFFHNISHNEPIILAPIASEVDHQPITDFQGATSYTSCILAPTRLGDASRDVLIAFGAGPKVFELWRGA